MNTVAYLASTMLRAFLMRQSLGGRLRTHDKLSAAVLGVILGRCDARAPCRSAACPVCGLAFQRAAVSVIDHFVREPARAIRKRMSAITIVPVSGCIEPGRLSVADCHRTANEIIAALATIAAPPTVLALELSCNEDTTGEVETHWCIHGHGLHSDWLSKNQKEQLRSLFPSSRRIKRPTDVEEYDGKIQGARYPFKPERSRRVTHLNTDHPTRKPYRDTKPRPLRASQSIELAVVEHQLGFSGRLHLHDIDEHAVWRHLEGLGWSRDGP